ncbi:sensor histidine kinase [Sinosporangium siamense]|uniref:histidine kinase n=1 Tax=Sinosporangium siamense TaxID=1367973 RepID=A0A919RC77_9ACTN|nr:sensor domain-containing protein [Sinosporangium siamense]GII91255.1 histidine kinase [Sinosporangium siamense]
MAADMAMGTRTAQAPLRDRVPLGPKGPIGLLVDPATWRALPYLVMGLGFGTLWFLVVSVGLSVSLSLIFFWVGVPLAALTMVVWRGAAMWHRRLIRLAFGVDIPRPYLPKPQDAGLIRRITWMLADPATWRDLAYLLLLLPLGVVETVVMIVLWVCTFGFLTAPLFLLAGEGLSITASLVLDTWTEAFLAVPVGVLLFGLTLYGVRGLAWLHATLGGALLGPDQRELAERAARLQASRARGVDAAEAERRRIERDLHDGAQQRLLSVAMDLGRAQEKMGDDPGAAWELVAQAHLSTKAAIAELRDLARGIYPAILTDRGLDAALSALAARSAIHVDVSVDLGERPPAAVESIAYFTVAESLANITKHSAATEASIRVSRELDRVVVEVFDNGLGGAVTTPGGGLAGLADRAATIDGILSIDSPAGGPTLLRAVLPCEW